jgi:hypothetical protein
MFRRNVAGFGSGIVCIEYLRGRRAATSPSGLPSGQLRRGIRPWRGAGIFRTPYDHIDRSRSVARRLRVSRANELGTVVENDGKPKVQWDEGKTSYYSHAEEANAQLVKWGARGRPSWRPRPAACRWASRKSPPMGRGKKTGTVVYICEICQTEARQPYQVARLAGRPTLDHSILRQPLLLVRVVDAELPDGA